MAGAGTRLGQGAIPIVLALAGAVVPPGVAAGDDSALILPGTTLTAATADLDGDGDREIVRLIQDGDPTSHAIDAWEHDGAGWSLLDSIPIPAAGEGRTASPDPVIAVALLPWTVAGRDRVLAFSAELQPDEPNGATCCLMISEVRLAPDGLLELHLLQRVDSAAQSFLAADVDGDGNDDLVLYEHRFGPDGGNETASLMVLRWGGSRFDQVFDATDPRWMYGLSLAESDGAVGDDILSALGADGSLHRLAWMDGALRAEETHIDLGGPDEGWVVGVADGTILLSLVDEARTISWPRGEDAVTVSALPTLTYPGLMLVGDGPDALVALQEGIALDRGEPPTLVLHDLELRPLGEVRVDPQTEDFWTITFGRAGPAWNNLRRNLNPYTGPLYGVHLDGRSAFAASGMLIQPGGPDGYDARPMASLIGVQPIGVAGPDDAWAVVSDSFGAASEGAYLLWGGDSFGLGRVTVTPLDQLLRTDNEVMAASFALDNAVELTRNGSAATLLADRDGFQVVVTAPEGSTVLVANDTRLEDHEVGREPLIVDIHPGPRDSDDVNKEFEAMVVVIAPDGRGTTARWTGTFVREPPEVRVTAVTDAMALSATLDGRATPGSTVTANGRPIRTDANGRFETSVAAPIWPSHVVVTARDPLGNEATELIEVVGMVDYRDLPWAAIMVVATLLVGGVLYVRTPKRRAVHATPDGDGRLEELELDAIDGIEPGRR